MQRVMLFVVGALLIVGLQALDLRPQEPGGVGDRLVLRGKSRDASSMAFSPDGRRFAAADEKEVVLWESDKGRESGRLQVITDSKFAFDRVTALAFNADGTLLAGATYRGVIQVWDVATGKRRVVLQGRQEPAEPVLTVAMPADNRSLVSVSGPDLWAAPRYQITVWDLETGREIRAMKGQGASFGFKGLFLSPNGRHAAALNRALEQMTIWDVVAGRERYTLEEPIASNVAFRRDSQFFAAYVAGEAIIVWDVETGRAMHSLKFASKPDAVGEVAFSADGKHLSAISTRWGPDLTDRSRDTYTLHVWEIASGKETRREQVSTLGSYNVESADGSRDARSAADGTIHIRKR